MRTKKAAILLAVLCMALTATACSTSSNQDHYETAQLYLGCGEFAAAADLFHQLGEYADSAEYALYCEAMQAIADGDFALARTNLRTLVPFKSSARYLTWLDALEAEEAADLEQALSLYTTLGTFENSHTRAAELREAIPEAALKEGRALMSKGEYAAARDIFLSLEGYGASVTLAANCTAALNKAAYDQADALCETGDHQAALAAFTALGDVLDAAERATACRTELIAALEKRYETVTLSTAAALAEDYAAIDDDAARIRVKELTARFGMNLQVLADAADHPYVLLEDATLWQVESAQDTVLTLRFVGITGEGKATAAPTATATAAPTSAPTAVPTVSATDAATAAPEATNAPEATKAVSPAPTAAPTLLPMTADLTPDGLTLKLDLTVFTFTKGDGSAEHPYQ